MQWQISVEKGRKLGARLEWVGLEFVLALSVSWTKKAIRIVMFGVSFHAGMIPQREVTSGDDGQKNWSVSVEKR